MKRTPGSKAAAKIDKAKYQLERERHRQKLRRKAEQTETKENDDV